MPFSSFYFVVYISKHAHTRTILFDASVSNTATFQKRKSRDPIIQCLWNYAMYYDMRHVQDQYHTPNMYTMHRMVTASKHVIIMPMAMIHDACVEYNRKLNKANARYKAHMLVLCVWYVLLLNWYGKLWSEALQLEILFGVFCFNNVMHTYKIIKYICGEKTEWARSQRWLLSNKIFSNDFHFISIIN